MFKKTSFFFLIILLASLVISADSEIFFPETAGDPQLYKPDFTSDSQIMTYFWRIISAVIPIDSQTYPSGRRIMYDIRIELDQLKQNQNNEFSFKIFLKNNGDTPDEDSELIYFLESPDKEIYSEAKEVIFEVPPINYEGTNCKEMGGLIKDEQCTTILERKVKIPSNAPLGEWTLKAEYYTVVQPVREAHQTFEVVKKTTAGKFLRTYWWCLLIILILLVLLGLALTLNRKKKVKN